MSYEQAKAVWAGGVSETAPALSQAARDLLGYSSAALDTVLDGSWASCGGGRKPTMRFAPLGFTRGPAGGPGAIVGQVSSLDLSTGILTETVEGGGLRTRGKLFLNSDPDYSVGAAWLDLINGRKIHGNAITADFAVDAKNPALYSWNNCGDNRNCMLLFVLALATTGAILPLAGVLGLLPAGAALGAALATQSLSYYCGIYPCNKPCTQGVISVETRYWVRLDASGDGGGGDVVLNNVALASHVDMTKGVDGEWRLSSKHYRGENFKANGNPIILVFKGTILDLGASGIRDNSGEDVTRQMNLLLVPPSKPSEVIPGAPFGLEKRN